MAELLTLACQTLDEFFPDGDEIPREVREWWAGRKAILAKERVARSEAGFADAALHEIIERDMYEQLSAD